MRTTIDTRVRCARVQIRESLDKSGVTIANQWIDE